MYLIRGFCVVVATLGLMTVVSPIFRPEPTTPGYTAFGSRDAAQSRGRIRLVGKVPGLKCWRSRQPLVSDPRPLGSASIRRVYARVVAKSGARSRVLAIIRYLRATAAVGVRIAPPPWLSRHFDPHRRR